jgi:hypothetical protein
LRHQLQVLERSRPQRLRLTRADRLLWAWFSHAWTDWHTKVDTTINVYTQVLDGSVREAAACVGDELRTIVRKMEGSAAPAGR